MVLHSLIVSWNVFVGDVLMVWMFSPCLVAVLCGHLCPPFFFWRELLAGIVFQRTFGLCCFSCWKGLVGLVQYFDVILVFWFKLPKSCL